METSLRPKRLGLLIQTELPLVCLRRRLHPRWARRICPVHAPAGRYFLEPSTTYFSKVLHALDPKEFGSCDSSLQASQAFFTGLRLERLRRATLVLEAGDVPLSPETQALRRILLRIESLPYSSRLDRLWLGLARDFDHLWENQHFRSGPGSLRTQAGLGVCRWLWQVGWHAQARSRHITAWTD